MRKLCGLLVIVVVVACLPVAALAYPGDAFFSYQCGSGTIIFLEHNSPVIQVSFAQIAGPLSTALTTGQNQLVADTGAVSLWALASNELQIHENANSDGTKKVMSAGICGPITISGANFSAEALAYVQLNGPGQALAFAYVDSSGNVIAYAQVNGEGEALAAAQSSGSGGGGSSCAKYHIVQAGENLFRIALNNGVDLATLAALNGISDPKLIYVGQKICLP